MEVENIAIKDFDYALPEGRIALHPLPVRDSCRLLVASKGRETQHARFTDLPGLLDPKTLLICNNTRVINARMEFAKSSGARIEIFLLEPLRPASYPESFASTDRTVWSAMIGNLRRWKEGGLTKSVTLADGRSVDLHAVRLEPLEGGAHAVELSWDNPGVTLAEIVEAAGSIPIPPYLKRKEEKSDLSDYQTVYSKTEGSVAAPTAGLHFTPELFGMLSARGVRREELTLHVGAGTFQPVKADQIGGHPMHTEVFTVTRRLVEAVAGALASGDPIVAVGTTSVRTLESLPLLGRSVMRGERGMHVSQWEAYDTDDFDTQEAMGALTEYMDTNGVESLTASTAIMIAPTFRWRIVSRMVTNFHQPQSTLLLLVSSFLEPEGEGVPTYWRELYSAALGADYRFLSYGDACLFSHPDGYRLC